LGYNIGYNSGRKEKSTGPYKAAVSRLYFRVALYTRGKSKGNYDFHGFRSTKAKREWKAALPSDTIFPGGFYFQRPKGVSKKNYRVKLLKGGRVSIKVNDKRKIHDISVLLDATKLADDSKIQLEEKLSGLKRGKQLLLTVNGHEVHKGTYEGFNDLESFNRYINEETSGLIAQLNDSEFDFKKWGKKIFGVKIVYSQAGEKPGPGEGEVFDFKDGSIFDHYSKRVYGRKKYLNRKQYTKRKGRRKGK
jgi:hypothetical protein